MYSKWSVQQVNGTASELYGKWKVASERYSKWSVQQVNGTASERYSKWKVQQIIGTASGR
jgi:hypothetical protein